MVQKNQGSRENAIFASQDAMLREEIYGYQDKRHHQRLDLKDLKKIVSDLGSVIPVEIVNLISGLTQQGIVQDISSLGVQVASPGVFMENDQVNLVFSIGNYAMSISGEIRWITEKVGDTVFGIRFINPDDRDVDFINSIFDAI